MFQFPAFALPALCVQAGVTLRWGFPIRTSQDQRSFASSPELIAGCRVLHRFSMPRHPPYTLKSLTTFTDHRHPSIADFRLPNADCSDTQHPNPGQRKIDRACHDGSPGYVPRTDRSRINVVHRRKRCSTTPPLRKDTVGFV